MLCRVAKKKKRGREKLTNRLSSKEGLPAIGGTWVDSSPWSWGALGTADTVVLVSCGHVLSSSHAHLSHFLFLHCPSSRQICPCQDRRGCSLQASLFWVGDDDNVDDEGNIFTTYITIMSPY